MWGLENSREDTLVDALAIPESEKQGTFDHIKMSSPLSVILTQNKLTGKNFNYWKRNLLIVLNFEKHSFVPTQPRPPTPVIDAPDREFVALECWDNSNLSAMCYIRASMSNVLQKQNEEHETARQIMDNLEEMFGEQTIQAKTDAIKGLMKYKQKVGTPIKEHMMKIMAYLFEAQANGDKIDAATQLVMVFQILFKDFDLFQASYNLNLKEMSLTKLMKELQAFENIFKGYGFKAEANGCVSPDLVRKSALGQCLKLANLRSKVRVNANLGLGLLYLVCMDPIGQFMGSYGTLEALCVAI
ncbi:hypothetical protein TIFTF001_030510 [Ficus carica]|uniref:Uncharacterized protein n=1 Tax=Ficus carica TaxID=3494 RepID=A0AA88DTT8_FICCA|nr:hypothetical protein TIFTF001_030510 [Ficus carica]